MKHVGDVCKLSGQTLEPADVIIGGSPCQGLSVAGKQEGLADKRSGLFMEQIRIIKEMREADVQRGRTEKLIRPRYQVWENVPGAFSTNGGADFRAVLEETAKIADQNAIIPKPPKGKWSTSGCVMGDGWSIAWRVLDAQFWGVPQRRRRIALVADFGGESAPEILFEREGVYRDITKSTEARKEIAGRAGKSINLTAAKYLKAKPRFKENNDNIILQEIYCIAGNIIGRQAQNGRDGCGFQPDTSYTLTSADQHAVYDCRGNGSGDIACTITGDHQNRVSDYTNITMSAHKTVRRLTPLECERLQGYPDYWTNITGASDSCRYKAIGNSIAIPPWAWVLKRLCICCGKQQPTMGSLFDGIGGFPLIWERINGAGSCLWASEIEKFPIAVTTAHLQDKFEFLGRKNKNETML